MKLNLRAFEIVQQMIDEAAALRIKPTKLENGALVVDCGIEAAGGLEAGRLLAECCLSGLGKVSFVPVREDSGAGLAVQVTTDQPIAGCLASQYAGWEVKTGDFFAMGSGPMRAAANREELFEAIGHAERATTVVGVLETRQMPTMQIAELIAEATEAKEREVVLLVAPTASQAGTVQIAARSVETAMHKLHELEFDLDRVESGYGIAPLPPVAKDDLTGIGRTNDAILYGARVTLFVRGDDASLEEIGPQVPSSSSEDHGEPFADIFARYDHDFYKIDRLLFSPAVVAFVNLDSGRTFQFGEVRPDVIIESFQHPGS